MSELSELEELASRYPSDMSARALHKKLSQSDVAEVSVVSTFTIDTLVPTLTSELARRGVFRKTIVLPFASVIPSLLEKSGALQKAAEAIVFVHLEGLVGSSVFARASAKKNVDELIAALRTFLSAYEGTLWVGLCPPLFSHRRTDPEPDGRLLAWHETNLRLLELGAEQPKLRLVECRGGRSSFDPRMNAMARIPYSAEALADWATALARSIAAQSRPPKKVLVLDCDGVLWGGVVGEDGAQGIALDDSPHGRAHLAVQEEALALYERGVMLALCSKNDAEDVWRVFDERNDMRLMRNHIACARINWLAKSENLAAIAEELNVGIDSLVLLDDNPAEIAEVEANAPEVMAVHRVSDIEDAAGQLAELECFDSGGVKTQEDGQRTEMILAQRERATAALHVSPEEFLVGLELVAFTETMRPETEQRVLQLLQKTNQFNLTTRRHGKKELRELLERPGWVCHTVEVADRFGGYGLTALAISGPQDGAIWIDSFLLSCRVMGRGVEQGMLFLVSEQCRSHDLHEICCPFIPTPKNHPSASFLEDSGFTPSGNGIHSIGGQALEKLVWPSHIERKRRGGHD